MYQCHGSNVGPVGAIRSGNGGLTGGVPFVARPLAFGQTVDHYDESQQTFVVRPLESHSGRYDTNQPYVLAFPGMAQSGAGWAPPSMPVDEERCGPLDTKRAQCVTAFAWQQGVSPNDRSYPVRAGDYAGSVSSTRCDAVAGQFGVRRLTPRECERLQGFPDDWTLMVQEVTNKRGMTAEELLYYTNAFVRVYHRLPTADDLAQLMSDSARYRMLGNAVAVPVVEWIGRRIVEVESHPIQG